MARPPTILSGGELQGSYEQPAAQPLPTGLNRLAEGLETGSAAAAHALTLEQELVAKRREADTQRWVGDSSYQLANHLNEWQSKPENNESEDYAANFKKYAEEQTATYLAQAPNDRARNSLRSKMQGFTVARYNEALGVTERTRDDRAKQSVISQTSDALGIIRNGLGVPGVDSLGEAEAFRSDVRENIDQMFPRAPKTARKMRGYADTEFALGIAPMDEEAAKAIITDSKDIDEDDKPNLLYKITVLSKAQSASTLTKTDQTRRDHLASVEAGNTTEKLPLSFYQPYANPEHEKQKDDTKVDAYAESARQLDMIAPMNQVAAARAMNDYHKGINSEVKGLAYDHLVQQMNRVNNMREHDPVGWLQSYNPEVRAIESQMVGMTDPANPQYKSLLSARNNAILKYQGNPSPGTADVTNPDHYLYFSSNNRALMSAEEAKKNSAYVNKGTPGDVVQRFNEILAKFPDEGHASIAFNDMVELRNGEGVRPEYQLVWQNKDQWFVQSLVKALQDPKAIGNLSDETKHKLEDQLKSNTTWAQFEQLMINAGRNQEASAFKAGIMTYAQSLQLQEQEKMSDAVNHAVQHTLLSTLGFTRVNGHTLMIMRDQDAGHTLQDPEVDDIGRRLNMALRDLDPRTIDQRRLVGLAAIHPDENNLNRLQALRNIVTRTGFFVNEGDGKSATLFVTGDDGISFQLRDKENRAFQIFFNDMPRYELTMFLDQGPMPFPIHRSQDTYPLQTGYNSSVSWFDKVLGWPQKQTYWPQDVFTRKELRK